MCSAVLHSVHTVQSAHSLDPSVLSSTDFQAVQYIVEVLQSAPVDRVQSVEKCA